MDDPKFSHSEFAGKIEVVDKERPASWQCLLPIPTSVSQAHALLGTTPWSLSTETLLKRNALAVGCIVLLAGVVHVLGSLVSEDNDMLIYLGSLIAVALYLGRVPALVASAICLLFLSVGNAHSGFAITKSHSQYILSFSLFIFTAYIVSKLADQVRRDAWKSQQNARVLSSLHEFHQLCSRETSVDKLAQVMEEYLRRHLALGYRVTNECRSPHQDPEPGDQVLFIENGRCLRVSFVSMSQEERAFWRGFFPYLSAAYRLSVERILQNETHRRASVLEATQQLQSTLINSMSHDLQTPLSSILGTFEVLRDSGAKLPEEHHKELLDIGYTQTTRLLHLASNILNLSKIEGGGLRPALRWVDLAEILQQSLERFEQRQWQRVVLRKSVESAEVWGDATLLTQVLFNLLDNALKFSMEASTVKVEIFRSPKGLTLAVSDSGFGVALEEQDLIFDRFYRGQTPQKVPGSGLGLHICKGVIELHGGTLTVSSEPGRGSRFEVSLPLTQEFKVAC